MRSIPVDVSAFNGFMCTAAPEPKSNPRTGEVRTDQATGQPVFIVGVVAFRGRDSSVIQVTVVGEPKGMLAGMPVRLVGLEAAPWEVEGRSGVSFRAASVVAGDAGGPDQSRRPAAPAGRGGDAA